MTATLWLTSGDHLFWDVPRQVAVTDVRPGPEPGSQYARLEVPPDQPDGPLTLLVTRRDGRRWRAPRGSGRVEVLLWKAHDPDRVWTSDGVRPPSPRPAAWATLTASQVVAETVSRAASAGWGGPG